MSGKLQLNNEAFFEEINQMLQNGHSVTFRAKGNSMFPFIVDGRDSIVLQKVKEIMVGSVVLACLPDKRYVLHRVYALDGELVVLMGDGNLYAMESCRREDIIGEVVKIIRRGRVVDCRSSREQWKAGMWRVMRPFRRYLLFLCRCVRA